jgi:DNA-binding SARP family transcriptional activator
MTTRLPFNRHQVHFEQQSLALWPNVEKHPATTTVYGLMAQCRKTSSHNNSSRLGIASVIILSLQESPYEGL